MNNTYLEYLFNFCEENVDGFKSSDCDESEHFYINGEMIGGFAGDSRSFFSKEGDALSGAIKQFEAYKDNLKNNVPQKITGENKIHLSFVVEDRGLGMEIKRIDSSKSFGYLDGPEDRVSDIIDIHNLKDLAECLTDMSDEFSDFPENPFFYIEDKLFASENSSGVMEIDDKFPKDLIEKYNTKKIKTLKTVENEDQSFSVFNGYHPYLSKKRGGEGFGSHIKDPIKFASKEDAIDALKINLQGENVFLDGKAFGENLPKTNKKQNRIRPR